MVSVWFLTREVGRRLTLRVCKSPGLYPTKKAESLRSSKAEIEAAFYEYLTNVLTAEEAAAFAAALNKLYTASKTESRAGFPHFRKAAGGEAAHEKG